MLLGLCKRIDSNILSVSFIIVIIIIETNVYFNYRSGSKTISALTFLKCQGQGQEHLKSHHEFPDEGSFGRWVYSPIRRLKLRWKTWISAVVLQQRSRARSLKVVRCSALRTREKVMLLSEATLVGVGLLLPCQRHTVYLCLEDTVPYSMPFASHHHC